MPQADVDWHGKMAEAWETLPNNQAAETCLGRMATARTPGTPRLGGGEWRHRLQSLDALQIFDDRLDIVWLEHKDRHVRGTGDDPLRQRLGQILDRVFGGQRPKGRRFLVRAVSFSTDRMAARAVLPDEHLALVDRGIACGVSGSAQRDCAKRPELCGNQRAQRRSPDAP